MKYNVNQFTWDKDDMVMTAEMSELQLMRFPKTLDIYSPTTKRTVTFQYDEDAAELNEGWDGEIAEYFPTDETVAVNRLVLFND